MKETAIEWLAKELEHYGDPKYLKLEWEVFDELVEQAKEKEKMNIIEAILYSLDEDGHTGDWKIRFANDYVSKKFN